MLSLIAIILNGIYWTPTLYRTLSFPFVISLNPTASFQGVNHVIQLCWGKRLRFKEHRAVLCKVTWLIRGRIRIGAHSYPQNLAYQNSMGAFLAHWFLVSKIPRWSWCRCFADTTLTNSTWTLLRHVLGNFFYFCSILWLLIAIRNVTVLREESTWSWGSVRVAVTYPWTFCLQKFQVLFSRAWLHLL